MNCNNFQIVRHPETIKEDCGIFRQKIQERILVVPSSTLIWGSRGKRKAWKHWMMKQNSSGSQETNAVLQWGRGRQVCGGCLKWLQDHTAVTLARDESREAERCERPSLGSQPLRTRKWMCHEGDGNPFHLSTGWKAASIWNTMGN